MGLQAAGLAFHWRVPYELLKRDPEAFAASIFDDARRFSVPPGTVFQPETVVDPLRYCGGPLLHTPLVDDRARGWQAVLANTERPAGRYAALTADRTPEERLDLEQQINVLLKPNGPLGPGELFMDRCQRELKSDQGLLQELQECRQEGAHLRAHLERAAREIRALRRSWTWRVGALLVRPTSRAVRWMKAWPQGLSRLRNVG
jgi:hypothetical protein